MFHIDEYREVYNMLSDEKSKIVFINLLAAKIQTDMGLIFEVSDINFSSEYIKNIYYNECNELESFVKINESFVDCGAYTGDTLKELLDQGLIPEKYFAFEPDKGNFEELKNFVNNVNLRAGDNIRLFNSGVLDKNGTVYFNSGEQASSRIEEKGAEPINVVALDEVIKEPVTLIKMDVEGSEYMALVGATRLIKEYCPKLAICIYHKPEDFRKLPILIKQINSNYKNYLIRHNGYNFYNTILYVY